jgi:branched-chain amino acid transport system substrate-binding protein
MKRSSVLKFTLALAALWLAHVPARADIVLGQSSDFSSPGSALTVDYVRGMTAYIDDVNRRGGIRGEKIKLISLDDAFNPDKTLANVKQLIETHNAVALVGSRGTANMLKIVPAIQAAGIAHIGNTSGAKSLRDPYVHGIFHLRAGTTDEVDAVVKHAATLGINKIAAFYQDDAFGKEGLEALNASMATHSLKPVAVAPVPRGTVDVSKAIEIISAAGPQAVVLMGQTKNNAAFIKGMRAKGLQPQFFVLSVSSGLYAELKEGAAGVIVAQVAPYPFIELGSPAVREYQTLIAQTANKAYSYSSLEGFLNAKVAVRALQKTTGPITRANVISALESFSSEDLGGFFVRYSKQSNLGSRYVALTMLRADGTFAR